MSMETNERRMEPVVRGSARSQGTVVEMGRAVAQVQAAVMSARQYPRDTASALRRVQDECRQPHLAQRAFFRYSRGGSAITGPSVHLARTLARCWGNIDFGLVELDRNDEAGVSEMLAYAADLESNARSSTTFLVPHTRSAGGDLKALSDPRDIYEMLANQGARRMREMIFAVLPAWLVEQAKEQCMTTLERGNGDPLPVRISKAVNTFAEKYGVSLDRLERALGTDEEPKRSGIWEALDVARLQTIYQALHNGETTVDEEFPAVRITAAQVAEDTADGTPLRTQRAPRKTARRTQGADSDAVDTEGRPVDPTTEPGFGQEPTGGDS